MTDFEELKLLATAATPGQWKEGVEGNQRLYGPDGRGEDSGLIASFVRRRDLSYIAAANPAVILALLSERDALRDRVAELEDALTLVLPMAKGYAHAHPVGGNAAKIASAEAALSHGDQP